MTALVPAPPEPTAADILLAAGRGQREPVPAPDLRRMQISEFAGWLRSRTNRHKRPFQEATVAAYADAARSLDRWMTDQGIDGDFTACDAEMLNRFFTGWVASHGNRASTRGSAICGTCSPGWTRPTGTRTRTPRRCSGTRR
jgi:hypothetical protein